MSMDALFEVTRAGLDFERARMDAASRRIADANTPMSAKGTLGSAGFDAHVQGADLAHVAEPMTEDGTRAVLDPLNPAADADGMVHVANVDLAQEMTTLMSAQRAYQADIRAFNTLHGMMMKSLDIGRNS